MVKVGGLKVTALGRIVVTIGAEIILDHPRTFVTEEMMEVNIHGFTKVLALDTAATMEKNSFNRANFH